MPVRSFAGKTSLWRRPRTSRNLPRRSGPPPWWCVRQTCRIWPRFGSLVIDRGVKHPAKSLSQLLLKHQKIPLIDGRYRAAGQLKRSIRDLLRNASALGERNLYIIGVGDEIFGELWQETLDRDQPAVPPLTPGTPFGYIPWL